MADVLILIPARMASTRLPGRPLLDIAGEPMIVHVMRRAQAARVGEVVVATDSEVIAACVEKAGGRAVMTRADHASGSDRIFEALEVIDPQRCSNVIVNMQADLPTLAPADIAAAISPLARFVALAPCPLEQRGRLEQLRALEAGMRIDASIVASVPLGVDTPADLERAREVIGRGKKKAQP